MFLWDSMVLMVTCANKKNPYLSYTEYLPSPYTWCLLHSQIANPAVAATMSPQEPSTVVSVRSPSVSALLLSCVMVPSAWGFGQEIWYLLHVVSLVSMFVYILSHQSCPHVCAIPLCPFSVVSHFSLSVVSPCLLSLSSMSSFYVSASQFYFSNVFPRCVLSTLIPSYCLSLSSKKSEASMWTVLCLYLTFSENCKKTVSTPGKTHPQSYLI